MQSPNASVGPTATRGPVLVVGTGLIGASIGLALRARGVEVWMKDPSPTSLALAMDMGAGTLPGEGDPTLVVVAAPPDVVGAEVAKALWQYPSAYVTDVASVKQSVIDDIVEMTGDDRESLMSRYAGSHPMAGRSRSGASSAQADLFYGRPWVSVPTRWSGHDVQLAVRNLAGDLGGVLVTLEPEEHDRAVALVSHVPQIVSSLLAARLAEAPENALALAGQGLRDTTRIASSDPDLWTRIIAGNAKSVAEILVSLRGDLDALIDRLIDTDTMPDMPVAPGTTAAISNVVAAGNRGVGRIPGKHGSAPKRWSTVEVLIPDEPGNLGRLFSDLGSAGVNIEDLTLDHSVSQPVGLARIMVAPQRLDTAIKALTERGWRIAGRDQQ
ncbi:prephenate dehydrogenase [Actinomycetaceae bacterium MB13-C1-2]|nr:prephenate dehydrogenase [Actinomycetaceae bacterium MB13-C1-2]